MRRFFENKTIVFLIIATIVALIVIGIFASNDRDTSAIENMGGTVVSPAQGAATGIGGWFSSITGYFGNVKTLRSENERLQNENVNLQKQINDMQGLEKENSELRKMLSLKKKQVNIDMIAASIITKDPSNWYTSFVIDIGENDGVKKNQPVVDSSRFLVGQISEVGENWARVITILDPQSSVGGYIRRSKEIGIVEGNSNLRYDGKCRLGYISRDTDIQFGDFVETSGLGGIFPKGLIIGKVAEIYDENATMSRAATIETSSDIKSLNEVFVILSYEESDLTESIDEDGEISLDSYDEDDEDDEDEEDEE